MWPFFGRVAAQTAEMDLVKTRIRQSLSADLATAPVIQDYRTTLLADGTWPDIDYASSLSAYWPPRTHLDRMKAMAKVYAWGSLQGDTTLRDDIFKAYDAWIIRDPQSPNWWYQGISTPQFFGEVPLLMGSEVSPARLASGLPLIARAYVPRSTNSGTNTGANRTERAYASMMRGLLANDSALTTESFLASGDTILVNSANAFAEGIQADGSFQQHGAQLYTSGYGYGFVQGVLRFASFGAGTGFGFGNLQTRVLLDYLLDGAQWCIRGDTMEYSSSGRGLARAGGGAAALGFIPMLPNAISVCGGYRQPELEAFLQRLSGTPSTPLAGNRNFWRSDFMVHHRPAFSVSIKTSSTRTLQPETGNGEALKNLHLGDGVSLIQRTGNEYDDIMAVWDWRRLPGTTVEQGTYSLKPTADWGVYGNSTHAGGVSDGTDGAAAFNYNRLGVAAKKSWFFLGDVMVALGSTINAPAAANPVLTTINQSLLKGDVLYRTGGGNTTLSGSASPSALEWVHHDGTGYFFPGAVSNASVAGVTQNGSWQSINTGQSAEPVALGVFSLHLNHGTAVSGGTYAYIVAPGREVADMDAFPVANYQILRNDSTVQAVKDLASNKTFANFWAAGTVGGLTCDSKASVLVKQNDGFLDIAISDPTQSNTGNITLELASPVAGLIRADAGITIEQMAPTLRLGLAAAKSYGRTFKARFHLRPNAFETITLVPVADSYVYDGSPGSNYGTSPTLACKLITTSNSYTRETYLGFDLSVIHGVPLAASLRLSPVSVATAGIHGVQAVAPGSWTESGLTWNNRPHPTGPATSTWLPALAARTGSDVLSAVLARSGNALDFSVTTMAPTFDGFVNYASRENSDPALHPTLELVLPRSEMEIWRIERFGAQSVNVAVAGNGADPDADGESNLYEFSTGQNPLDGTLVSPAMLQSGASLEFTYTRSKAAVLDGVTFMVEWSDDLLNPEWSIAGILYQNPPPISSNANT
jgi:chondroitin AC lyase